MTERIASLIVDEGKWLTISMTIAAIAAALLLARFHSSALPQRRLVMAAMNLFAGVTIATMGFGHLLAVTTRLRMGTLEGSPAILYPIGIAVVVPAGLTVWHTRALLADGLPARTVALNGWLAATLVILGLHNLPLAAPSLLNICYSLHTRRAVGLAIVSAALVFNVALFIGSVVFFLSGESFEQFTGIKP